MLHQRTVIRRAVRDLLIAANTAAGSRVLPNRKVSLRKGELAALCVYTGEELAAEEGETESRIGDRVMPLVIEGLIAPRPDASLDVDEVLDAFALQVERAMFQNQTLGGSAAKCKFASGDTEILEEGDRLMGWMTVAYDVTYQNEAVLGESSLDDFLSVAATTNLEGVQHADDDTHDEFVVQEAP